MAISERRRLTFTAIVVILVGIITGFLLGSVFTSGAPPTKTFNIVTYNWGFALYNEDWNEIEQMEVQRGTTVRLVAFPVSVLSDEIREQLWQRVIDKGFEEYEPGDPRIAGLIEAAYNEPTTADHSVFIDKLYVELYPKENASTLEEAIDSVEFTTDTIGSFNIFCAVECGDEGHAYMLLHEALVVK